MSVFVLTTFVVLMWGLIAYGIILMVTGVLGIFTENGLFLRVIAWFAGVTAGLALIFGLWATRYEYLFAASQDGWFLIPLFIMFAFIAVILITWGICRAKSEK